MVASIIRFFLFFALIGVVLGFGFFSEGWTSLIGLTTETVPVLDKITPEMRTLVQGSLLGLSIILVYALIY